ncbi:DUF1643 domain-containing protein [Thalassobaculum sp. OXR-137]|uniref:DUF1643 domain-containing protein n=1 Tax=Thalassobaculum sp. OXR-137 TaxID=3100173 RepID=UPI002AC93500|nr:DUF1643 domain-containing protein [Thalassobaculum sp. OXR-137]WPZ36721.1 DUF1643 domain-containing protein [Thalassobaculum sp. OXR-137]
MTSTGASPRGSAEFSPCGEHRLRLDRWWADGPRALIGLANPSKAGGDVNDPTVHRGMALTRERAAGMTYVNRDSYIATDPDDLTRWRLRMRRESPADLDRIERTNLDLIRELSAGAAIRIIACGNLVQMPRLPPFLAALSLDGKYPVYCFGLTQHGAPKHPLARGKSFIKASDPLVDRIHTALTHINRRANTIIHLTELLAEQTARLERRIGQRDG